MIRSCKRMGLPEPYQVPGVAQCPKPEYIATTVELSVAVTNPVTAPVSRIPRELSVGQYRNIMLSVRRATNSDLQPIFL
jgi:hypothetical protein